MQNRKWEKTTDKTLYKKIAIPYETRADFLKEKVGGNFVKCPCCDVQHNVVYKRRIYKSLVKALIVLFNQGKFIEPSSVGDFTKLKHWQIINQNNDGFWYVTEFGGQFLRNEIRIPEYVLLVNNELVEYDLSSYVSVSDITD